MRQVPDSVDLKAVFAEHKFGGARIRPVRMDAAMTAQVVPVKSGLGLNMVWTLLIEEKRESPRARGRVSYQPVVTLVADADEGVAKLLRDTADLIERGETHVERNKPNYRQLLAELYSFPEYPTPAEGEVTDAELSAEQERWRERYDALSKRIDAALSVDA